MFDWDLRRRTSSAHILLGLAEERGIPVAACLEGTALPPEALSGSLAEITARQELRIVRNLVRRCGREPGLGALAGSRSHLSLAGPWGLAMLSSRTVREVIEVARRYLDTAFVFGRLTFEETSGEARLHLDDSQIPLELRTFLTERALAGIRTIGRELFSADIPLARIEFRHAAPENTAIYREIFGVRPSFGAQRTTAAFDRMYVDLPLPRPTEWARAACEQMCRDMLARRHVRTGVAGSVRDLLIRNPGAIPDQIAVASEMFMSPRTLSRRLNHEGTSFRALLDEVRQTLSEELLTHTDMTTEQLAARLGYAEAASFIRAFRRWKGCPPQEFRLRTSDIGYRIPAMSAALRTPQAMASARRPIGPVAAR
ncbi:AraC family transcriptional regulator [Nocardia sp. NPDC005366]|uniref:AraC family transcriptional regulator n=1 Tax=Nocardia sp. NPDC005366 TaxID=3156878 RepID=UPI0033B2A4D2